MKLIYFLSFHFFLIFFITSLCSFISVAKKTKKRTQKNAWIRRNTNTSTKYFQRSYQPTVFSQHSPLLPEPLFLPQFRVYHSFSISSLPSQWSLLLPPSLDAYIQSSHSATTEYTPTDWCMLGEACVGAISMHLLLHNKPMTYNEDRCSTRMLPYAWLTSGIYVFALNGKTSASILTIEDKCNLLQVRLGTTTSGRVGMEWKWNGMEWWSSYWAAFQLAFHGSCENRQRKMNFLRILNKDEMDDFV